MANLLNNTRIAKMRAAASSGGGGSIQGGKPRRLVLPYVAPLIVSTGSIFSQILDPLGFNVSTLL